MVLLAAAVCTKQGKALMSRQFVEMSRARIEGLLSTFPKLMSTGKQHTFVETESVRYVYQPLERLYMLLITTKASNILEDLETLRLFSRVIPEYCSSLNEQNILDNAFDLILAFDEIIALGYRENVNLAQIRTFTEMDSHEEKVYDAMRRSQEKEAKDEMKRKSKELQMAKREARKEGRTLYTGGFSGGYGSYDNRGGGMNTSVVESLPPPESRTSYNVPSRTTGSAMKLGRKKGQDVESFVDKLVAEGQIVSSAAMARQPAVSTRSKALPTPAALESVHLRVAEKLVLVAGHDGGLQNMEVHGIITLKVTDPDCGKIQIHLENKEKRLVQFQTHPKVDKQQFNQHNIIAMKQEGVSFPINQDVGVLKWRFQTTDESFVPLSINCWPSQNNGVCDVNIEYELVQDYLVLSDLKISIPIPSGVGSPVIGVVDGEYDYNSKKHLLNWRLPQVDSSNKEGNMEFSIPGSPADFFPVSVNFFSSKAYCNIEVMSVTSSDTNKPIKFSCEFLLSTEKFEIV